VSRCRRYGAATRIAPSANGKSADSPTNQAQVEAAEEQDAEGDRDDDDERAEVRLEQQQAAIATITANSGGEAARQRLRSGCRACRNAALRTA